MAVKSVSYSVDEWIDTVTQLGNQVEKWAKAEGWHVHTSPLSLEDQIPIQMGVYQVPELTIETPYGRLRLEPIGMSLSGKGSVEFYAWPTLYRVRLLRGSSDIDWEIMTDSGIPLHQEWNSENFIRLAKDLLRAN